MNNRGYRLRTCNAAAIHLQPGEFRFLVYIQRRNMSIGFIETAGGQVDVIGSLGGDEAERRATVAAEMSVTCSRRF